MDTPQRGGLNSGHLNIVSMKPAAKPSASPVPMQSSPPNNYPTHYYLKLAEGNQWDEVDEFTFKNRKWATDDDYTGKPRYSGVAVIQQGRDNVTLITPTPLTADDIARIARFTGAHTDLINASYSMAGGIVLETVMVHFLLRGQKFARNLKNGIVYVVKSDKPKKSKKPKSEVVADEPTTAVA